MKITENSMSILKGARTHDDIQTKDSLGTGGNFIVESGVYDAIVDYAYTSITTKGGVNVNVGFDVDGVKFKETYYVMNDKGENTYEYNGQKSYYKGFTTANDLSLMTAKKELADLDDAKKYVELYDFDLQKKVDTEVDMLIEMVGKPVKLAILKQIEPKKTQQNGEWVETDETREVNVVAKVFHPTKSMTVNELTAGKDEPQFITAWADEWTGKDKVIEAKNKGKAKTNSSKPFKKTSSLFA